MRLVGRSKNVSHSIAKMPDVEMNDGSEFENAVNEVDSMLMDHDQRINALEGIDTVINGRCYSYNTTTQWRVDALEGFMNSVLGELEAIRNRLDNIEQSRNSGERVESQ